MKKILILLLVSGLMITSVFAQTVSTLTINVKGNSNDAIIIDGKEYAVANDNNTTIPIVVSNLQAGQHTLQIKRRDELNIASIPFTIRTGYDLQITITANGSVQQRETKWRADNNTAVPM